MKILLIFYLIVNGSLEAKEPWEVTVTPLSKEEKVIDETMKQLVMFGKPTPLSKEEKVIDEKLKQIMMFVVDYASTGRKATKEEIQLIDELYQNESSSKVAIYAKAYSFATMSIAKDISVWSKELPILLKSTQLAGFAIDAVYYVYKKGTRKEKLHLLKERKLQEQLNESLLNESLEKFDAENFAAKINKISELVKENKYLLDEPDLSKNLRGVRRGDEGEEPFGNDLVSKPKNQNEPLQEVLEAEPSPSRLPWIIVGVLLVGILVLLLKTFKGKSTS